MPRYVAFLRAVNVGGTGKLPMADLRDICAKLGFADVKTYIASGNVVFDWSGDADAAASALEAALLAYAGKPVGVMVRTGAEMARIVADTPFPDAPGNKVVVMLLKAPPPADMMAGVKGQKDEVIVPGTREIYVHYPDGQGPSKLVIAAAAEGTARNFNTITKMADWLASD